MGRKTRTQVELLIDALCDIEGHRASLRVLAEYLGWSVEKVERVRKRAMQERPQNVLKANGPGTVTMYVGSGTERVGAGSRLYADISRVIEKKWGPNVLGLRNITTVVTAKAGTKGSGVWSHPDIVVAADPRKRSSRNEQRRLHSIEVETADGFDLRSVYQAHAQGRGASYSWVFGSKQPDVTPADWERVIWTAHELGVGVVTFESPAAYTSWTTHVEAELREHEPWLREEFLEVAIGGRLRAEHGI